MAYLGATDIPFPAHVVLTGSSNPTLDQVASMIAEVAGEIDAAAAAAGYIVPVIPAASGGATEGYAFVVGLAKKGITGRVLSIMFPNLPVAGTGNRATLGADYLKQYEDALALIRTGGQPIPGAAIDSSETNRLLPRSYSESNSDATSGVVAQIQVGMQF